MRAQHDIDRVAQALSDPRRVQILDLLAAERHPKRSSPESPQAPGALCAADLRPALGGIAPSKLGYHLKQLREAGLIDEHQRGKWVYYTLDRAALDAFARLAAERWGERDDDTPVRGVTALPAPARAAGAPAPPVPARGPSAAARPSGPARAALAFRAPSLILEED